HELDAGRVAPARHRVRRGGVPGRRGSQRHRYRAAGALLPDAFDVELPRLQVGRHRGGPQVAGRVDEAPAVDAGTAADDRGQLGDLRRPDDPVAVPAGVARVEVQRFGEVVLAGEQPYRDVGVHR